VKRLLQDPVTLFFALGALLFLAYQALNGNQTTPITLSEAGEAVLVSEFEMLTGRTAEPDDVERLAQEFYQRELLFLAALDAELYRSDPGIREQLIEQMQQRVTGEIADPSGRELVNYYADHMQRYYSEATISFEQRFFTQRPDNPGLVQDALNRGDMVASEAPPQGRSFPGYGLSMIRGLFGQGLLEVLSGLETGQWRGPYESIYGWHYFRVENRSEPVLLPFEAVRDQVAADLQAARIAERVRDFVDARGDRYPFERPR
jgi:peptidyl-prolyl cis-trans isomerase C